MLRRDIRFQKGLRYFTMLIAFAAILFSLFSVIAIRTNVDVVRGGFETIRSLFGGEPLANILINMQASLSGLYAIVLAEIFILLGGMLASLYAITYLIKRYYVVARVSLVDELTQTYNRRALYRILDQEIKRAKRFKHPLTVLMMDIDFFKVYNDKNGHVAGDELLQRLSRILGKGIRGVDTLARYGGEEFLVIFPETSHEHAALISERIRKKVESTRFKGEETQPNGNITLSMGLVTYHGEYKERNQLIHSADELLYKAKELGRNKLIKAYYKYHKTSSKR